MDLSSFNSDEEIAQYLREQIEMIKTLNECRLYKEEQLQLTEEILHFRNCIEWIIRSNQVINNIKYALIRCLEFAEAILWPLEETENKRMYSFYLEDSVYRDLVLWDMFRQLLNEFFNCGYAENSNITIFSFLKNSRCKIGNTKVDIILSYLNSPKHKMVRETLRNSFTHSVDPTSSFIFHQNTNGKITPQFNYVFPNHPYENIKFVIMDTLKLIDLLNEIVNEMYEYRNNNLILLEVISEMPCGKSIKDSEHWNLHILKEMCERILVPCAIPCDKATAYNQAYVCKPVRVMYKRIYSNSEKTSGIITLN